MGPHAGPGQGTAGPGAGRRSIQRVTLPGGAAQRSAARSSRAPFVLRCVSHVAKNTGKNRSGPRCKALLGAAGKARQPRRRARRTTTDHGTGPRAAPHHTPANIRTDEIVSWSAGPPCLCTLHCTATGPGHRARPQGQAISTREVELWASNVQGTPSHRLSNKVQVTRVWILMWNNSDFTICTHIRCEGRSPIPRLDTG